MELTKEILGEELANQLTASTDATVKALVEKLKSVKVILGDATMYVPKADFNEKNELAKSLKTQLDAIKTEAESVPALKARITEIQAAAKAEKDAFDATQVKSKKSAALLVALLDNGVSDPTAREVLSKNFDVDKLELDEAGKPKGFDVLLKPLKENVAFKGMFGQARMVGQEHQQGDGAEPISDLERQLAEAEKAGKPLVERVTLKRLIAEEKANKT